MIHKFVINYVNEETRYPLIIIFGGGMCYVVMKNIKSILKD